MNEQAIELRKTQLTTVDPRTAVAARNLDDVKQLASAVAKAGLYGVKSAEEAMIRMVVGMELGLSPLQSIRGVFCINTGGKTQPGLYADLMVGVCKQHTETCEYFRMIESTAQKATFETKRVGEPKPVTMSFTIEEARQAGLAGKDVWKSYPPAMLRARASSALARTVYPDLLNGLYSIEELQDMRSAPQDVPGDILTTAEPIAERGPEQLQQPAEKTPEQQHDTHHRLRMSLTLAKSDADLDDIRELVKAANKTGYLSPDHLKDLQEYGKACRAKLAKKAAPPENGQDEDRREALEEPHAG